MKNLLLVIFSFVTTASYSAEKIVLSYETSAMVGILSNKCVPAETKALHYLVNECSNKREGIPYNTKCHETAKSSNLNCEVSCITDCVIYNKDEKAENFKAYEKAKDKLDMAYIKATKEIQLASINYTICKNDLLKQKIRYNDYLNDKSSGFFSKLINYFKEKDMGVKAHSCDSKIIFSEDFPNKISFSPAIDSLNINTKIAAGAALCEKKLHECKEELEKEMSEVPVDYRINDSTLYKEQLNTFDDKSKVKTLDR